MPYIIVHKAAKSGVLHSRRAVATSPDAREAVANLTAGIAVDASSAVPKRGLRVGDTVPLPDGTAIEVQRVTYDELAGVVFDRDDYAPVFESDILAAYNRRKT